VNVAVIVVVALLIVAFIIFSASVKIV